MRFLTPSLFYFWAALVIVPLVLYLFRPRPRTVRTSTLPFFKWLAKEHQESSWLRRLKHLLSLLLTLLVLLGGAAVLGKLVIAPPADAVQSVVILVDRSASMAAKDGDGNTRLEAALAELRARVAGLPAGIGVVVMTYDSRPEVLLPRSVDRRQVDRALAKIEVRPVEDRPAVALQMARRLAALETPAVIWHATDAPVDPALEPQPAPGEEPAQETAEEEQPEAGEVNVELLNVALPEAVNVGLTAVNARRLPQERNRFEVFVQVQSSSPEPVEAELDIYVDGDLRIPRQLSLEPGSSQRHLIDIEAEGEEGNILTLKLSAPGDLLEADNVVNLRLPSAEPIKVVWITPEPDPFTEAALTGMDTVQVFHGAPADYPPADEYDVVIFDNWLPETWPKDKAVIVISPNRGLGPVQAAPLSGNGLPINRIRTTEEGHPVLYNVAASRLAITQTSVVDASGPLEPLWVSDQGPVLLAGESDGKRVVVMAFSPIRSEFLQLTIAWPLLMGNAIYWAGQETLEAGSGQNYATGSLVELRGSELTWTRPDLKVADPVKMELQGEATELDRLGLWETEAGETGSAALLSARETALPVLPADASAAAETSWASGLFRGDLIPLLLWSLLVILVLESWLFHRHGVY